MMAKPAPHTKFLTVPFGGRGALRRTAESLGQFKLWGVGEPKEIFGLRVPHIATSVGPGLIAHDAGAP